MCGVVVVSGVVLLCGVAVELGGVAVDPCGVAVPVVPVPLCGLVLPLIPGLVLDCGVVCGVVVAPGVLFMPEGEVVESGAVPGCVVPALGMPEFGVVPVVLPGP